MGWHERRRAAGIPTVSVLLGPAESGAAVWHAWARRVSAAVIDWRGDADLPTAWLSSLLCRADVRCAGLVYLARQLRDDAEELAGRVSRGTRHERELMLRQAGFSESDPLERFFRVLLLSEELPRNGGEWRDALGSEGDARIDGARIARALWPDRRLPALLLRVGQGRGQAAMESEGRVLCDWVQAMPEVAAGVAVESAEYDAFLASAPESRHKALLRETPLRLAVPEVPARDEADLNAKALRSAGAGEAVVEAYRELSRKAASGALANDGARSEAERFVRDLLEGLPQTAGLFELNGRLPIPFGPQDWMEVDFLCRRYRLAVEIDGYHHFREAARYRSDRTKDYLLQKEDYLVLRFLAEDVVVDLEGMLGRLLDALDSRGGRMT